MKRIFLSALILSVFVGTSAAQEPAWGINIDIEKLRESSLYKFFEKDADSEGRQKDIAESIGLSEEELGFNPIEDLTSFTAYNTSFGKEEGVMLLKGKFKTEKIEQFLEKENTHSTSKHGKYTVHEWTQEDMKLAGSIISESFIVAATDKAKLTQTLDGLDKNSQTQMAKLIEKDKTAASKNAYFYVTAKDIGKNMDEQQSQQNPMARQVKDIVISAGENGGNFYVNSLVTAVSPEAAAQLQQMITGMTAMFSMQAQQQPDSPVAKMLQPLKISNDGSKISLSYEYPAEELAELIKKAQQSSTQKIAPQMQPGEN
ncbi:hypothetical protein SMSP2_02025 [Limihaloglobus sulfuriphilus]|uniref:DUF4412 domain-containing protein n=1 Tax=Limihaloglobus sulfuriphilus TaxID=1851148 RepID=A0A1Q2MGH9_9BACT|nr:hypothetical protein [Limihaloglobus sulfuriphilus]AQQ71648.1 hypothetical protein SMSP2_02025 [Limihaloglobus sulfuriphilus]